MTLTTEHKVFGAIIIATLLIIGIGVALASRPSPKIAQNELITANTHTTGNKDAKVVLVEFSDYQCPACRAYFPVVEQLIETHKDTLYFAYRHYPLAQHPYSRKAVAAAEAAAEQTDATASASQSKFWEMGKYLFEHQDTLSDQTVAEGAKELQLDMEKFNQAFTSGKYEEKMTTDIADGTRAGVNSTPSFFLNGQKMQLTGPEDLKTQVEKAINEAK